MVDEKFQEVEYLHQVFIVDDFKTPTVLPKMLEEHAQIARDFYPNAKYKLWGGEELRRFLKQHFEPEVLEAFDTLTPYSYKCDLARYCLMYVYGGIYFDLAVKMLNRWDIPSHYGMAAFTEVYPGMDCWACVQTSLLWSRPGRREWEIIIKEIVDNVRNRYYGPHDHYPTAGPLLGRSIAAAMLEQPPGTDDQYIGEIRYITPECELQNVTFVSPDRTLVAARNKLRAGDIAELGVTGANNYCHIWRAKTVYGEKQHIWKATDRHLVVDEVGERTARGIYIPKGAQGRVMYGPFTQLPPGNYVMDINFSEDTRYQKFYLDIASDGGNVLFDVEFALPAGAEGRHSERVYFTVPEGAKDLEFRMRVFGDFSGTLESIVVTRPEEYEWEAHNSRIVLDEAGTLTPEGIVIRQGEKGRVMYGPFVNLEPGLYELRLEFDENTTYSRIQIGVSGDWNKHKLALREMGSDRRSYHGEEKIFFKLTEPMGGVEFFLFVDGSFEGTLKKIHLQPTQPGSPAYSVGQAHLREHAQQAVRPFSDQAAGAAQSADHEPKKTLLTSLRRKLRL
ncbi:hypothetical protein E3E11_06230 [Oecophyllibacter saccharovorans]|uniref:glycosyltransferase family 32 protein n=1 Tax=Oecophyllibacter saccharovorans TaxID=2558360 RepID=UPI0011428AF5|nr:glycosyltransferase [Oecophyllibacter saccharovorans]QDH15508.1 hypothetical protein E3E11_06230 [Oecophyllibacter saccharovorans]